MKQLIMNITKNAQGETIIVNMTNNDDTTFKRVVMPTNISDKDKQFLNDLETLVNNYKE